jgi:uncharacterized Zn finger protein
VKGSGGKPRKPRPPRVPTHNTHSCPDCGTEETECYTGTSDVVHTHKCPDPECGKVWKHHPDDVTDLP